MHLHHKPRARRSDAGRRLSLGSPCHCSQQAVSEPVLVLQVRSERHDALAAARKAEEV